jgi:GlpG protein
MRLIATLQDEKQGILLSNYLKSQDIDNVLESSIGHDWGDDSYGAPTYTVWIVEERNLEKALQIAGDFTENSNDPRFQLQSPALPPADNQELPQPDQVPLPRKRRNGQIKEIEPLGTITLYLLLLCSLLYFFGEITAPTPTKAEVKAFTDQSLPLVPLFYPELNKELIFDYPHAFEVVDELITKIDADKLQETSQLPSDLQPLVEQFRKTPYWTGFYDKIVAKIKNPQISWDMNAPLFEKIREGELWRLITPAFLHADMFHLLFNMIWLAILGKQLEGRLGMWRYLLFICIAAIITNTAQYLMTGNNFLGFSGVVCAMITFIWMRQRNTPWEGYLLQKSTLNFALLFLIFVLLLQMVSFYTEIAHNQSIAPQIANTAHMTGLLLGFILGSFNFFAWKTQ